MKSETTPFIRFYGLPELLSSDMQASMFSDVFSQIESKLNHGHSQTGIHDPRAPVAAISTVDEGIDAARQFVRSLLTRRNALVPISFLPPEILSWVFHLLVLAEPPLSGRRSLGWIRVTHVCRHWRQIALDDSSLWAKICGIPMNTKWISEMLARAKNAPLDIEFKPITRSSPEAFLMIPPHIFHTRQLRLHGLSLLHFNLVREIYSREAPALEHFELVAAYSPLPFPDLGGNMLFKGRSPRLRTFSLSQVVIPWSIIPRGQLTQLKIACPNEGVYSPGDLSQLIDLLVNCPALEILALDFCLPSQLTEFPHGRTVHLSNLSRLRLCGSTSRIMNMLKMLKLPSSTTLHLNCTSKITSIHNDLEGPILAIISAHFQSPAPVEFKSLTVTVQRHSLNIAASTFPSTLQDHQIQNFEGDVVGNAELVLSFDTLSKPGHSRDLLEQACKMLPISNLDFISTTANSMISINWVELFSRCTNVTTMRAIGHGTSGFVLDLTAPTVTDAGSNKGGKRKHDKRESTLVQPFSTAVHAHAAIFPKLKFLELAELNFFDSFAVSAILFDDLERGLQQRMATSGVPLKLLRVSDCTISIKHVNDLEKLVQDFQWDGNEGSIDGSEVFDNYELEESFYDVPWEAGFVRRCTARCAWHLDSWDDYSDEY
jgi:hypothetical protein